MKKCKDCGVDKEDIEFHKNGAYYRNRCRKCHNAKFQPPTGKKNEGQYQTGNVPENPFKKGQKPWNLGRIYGSGRTPKFGKYKIWRNSVLFRDGNKCAKCESQTDLHTHHIIPWKTSVELRFDVNNGLTLCSSCHGKEDREAKKNSGISTRFKKGHFLTSDTRKKISDANKTRIPWNRDKKTSDEVKKKQSASRKGKSPWNKGLRSELPDFRKCKMCEEVKKNMRFHAATAR